MKCKYLSDTGICKVTSDGEVSEPCVMGPCGKEVLPIEDYTNEITQTAAPRFSEEEKIALDVVLTTAEHGLLSIVCVEKIRSYVYGKEQIATVRSMLQEDK